MFANVATDFQVEYLLREWVRLCHQPGAGKESEKAFSTFVALVRNAVLVLRFRLCVAILI